MLKQVCAIIAGLLLTQSVFSQSSKNVLFIGNSYTYVNNLPLLVDSVANSMGDTVIFDSSTPGGYTLQLHSVNTTSMNKIMAGNWDYVVLQEQSQLPSFPINQVQSDCFPYAHLLDSVINVYSPCVETVFYMTWGRKNGDASNCTSWPPVCTYDGMDSLLHLRYMMMAADNNALVSPVGAVWNYIRQNYPAIELYLPDESHPSEAGSYAAACSFYTTIFRKNPLGISYDFTLPATDAANIRSAVKAVVYDSLMNWHVGEYDPMANFSVSGLPNNTIHFINTSSNATTYSWDFGDGGTSANINPTHSYAASGNYTVTLIVTHCNMSDTITKTVTATITGIAQNEAQIINAYPNPVTQYLNIDNPSGTIKSITVTNSLGQLVHPEIEFLLSSVKVNFEKYPSGIYSVRIDFNDSKSVLKVVKW